MWQETTLRALFRQKSLVIKPLICILMLLVVSNGGAQEQKTVIQPSSQTSPAQVQGDTSPKTLSGQFMQENLLQEWGRIPESGELWDVRRPWSISLSPDGNQLAVSMISPLSGGWMEIWKIHHGPLPLSWRYTPMVVFPDLLSWRMLWHPARNWLLAETEPIGLQLVNLDKKTNRALPVAAFMNQVTWLGTSDKALAVVKVSGERPNTLVNLDVLRGKDKPFNAPWVNDLKRLPHYQGIISQSASAAGDFAVIFAADGKREDIILYPRVNKELSWRKAGSITSRVDPSGELVARPMIVNWLSKERLAYAMIYKKQKSDSTGRVELWTCKRDGSDQKKWMDLPGAAPPTYNAIGPGWLTVSANGKRIAFFRNDKVFVSDTDKLATSVISPIK